MHSSKRPLSPHLQVYKPQLTSMLSIMHRGSGVFLSCAMVAMALWLIGLAYGPQVFNHAASFYDSFVGQALFVAFVASFFYHFCNGVRHLLWDSGYGFDLPTLYRTGWIVLISSVGLTIAYIYLLRGA